jgi:RimJ/RimL family protein N-acetyltransferase
VTSSLGHLRPWMPWSHAEPMALDDRIELLRGFRSAFDRDEDYVYGVFEPDGVTVAGGSGLHTRLGDDALEIGYWIREDAAGQGLATELSAALTAAAFGLAGVERVEIHVDPANAASCRVAEKLGFAREATRIGQLPPLVPDGPQRDEVVFAMTADELAGSPAGALSARIAAFDAAGRPLPISD